MELQMRGAARMRGCSSSCGVGGVAVAPVAPAAAATPWRLQQQRRGWQQQRGGGVVAPAAAAAAALHTPIAARSARPAAIKPLQASPLASWRPLRRLVVAPVASSSSAVEAPPTGGSKAGGGGNGSGGAATAAGSATAAASAARRGVLLTGASAERVERLELLVELKKLYRNCIRAEALLALPSPVYVRPEVLQQQQQAQQAQEQQQQQQAAQDQQEQEQASSSAAEAAAAGTPPQQLTRRQQAQAQAQARLEQQRQQKLQQQKEQQAAAAQRASSGGSNGSSSRGGNGSGGGAPSSSAAAGAVADSAAAAPTSAPLALSSMAAELDEEEAERVGRAVEVVAEMQLTSEQLKTGLRALPAGFGASVFGGGGGKEAGAGVEAAIRDTAKRFSSDLRERAAVELPLLPFSRPERAQAACDLRNARYNRRLQALVDELQAAEAAANGGGGGSGSGSSPGGVVGGVVGGVGVGGAAGGVSGGSLPDRLNQAERVAGQFVARRLRPALQRAREKDLPELLGESTAYLRGLWARLNGSSGSRRRALPQELTLPGSSRRDVERRIGELGLLLEASEKKLVEASKAREARLRKAGAAGRVAVALQMRAMDAEVVAISRLLAVRTLQLEMEYVYAALEEEALDVGADELLQRASAAAGGGGAGGGSGASNGAVKGGALPREGATGELALLVAEYGLLLAQLDVLVSSIAAQMGGTAGASTGGAHGIGGGSSAASAAAPGAAATSSSSGSSAAAKAAGLSLIDDDLLEELAGEIPDLRYRVGVPDLVVFGSNPLSPTRLRLQARETSLKVLEGVTFLLRGVRLLGSDVGNAGRLFTKAALGGTLRRREVAALRRIARDLLTFIPFMIILIVPLTPLGHVLVFGFIQRYFPGFFPSQFTGQRQDLMARYEELQRQLADAQAAAEAEEEEAELARAAAAVARLTAPEGYDACAVPGSGGDSARASMSGAATSALASLDAADAAAQPGAAAAAAAAAAAGAAAAAAGAAAAAVDAAAATAAGGSGGGSGGADGTGGKGGAAGAAPVAAAPAPLQPPAGPAAAKVALLEEQLQEARDEVHHAGGGHGGDEGDAAAGAATAMPLRH